jgi:hypothetical protein
VRLAKQVHQPAWIPKQLGYHHDRASGIHRP